MSNGMDLRTIHLRLAELRARRRRMGWFDFSPDSYDMRTTQCRAFRIFLRLRGERQPLESDMGRPLAWNAYHY